MNEQISIFNIKNIENPCSILFKRDDQILTGQKNWQFIELSEDERNKFSLKDDEILMLTDFFPEYRITKITLHNNNCSTFIINNEIKYFEKDIEEIYNTSTVVEFDEKYFITILHTGKKSQNRSYLCLFLLILRETLLPVKYSNFFKFVKTSFIEFPSGLTKKDSFFYISCGLNDLGYIVLKMKKEQILDLNFKDIF